MDPNIQKELLSWLQALKQAVETGVAFAKDQIPQLLWEKILLDRAYYTFLLVILIALLVFIGWAIKTLGPAIQQVSEAKTDVVGGLATFVFLRCAFGILAIIASLIILCNNTYPFLMVWFAPRLYLIEWVREIVKG